jgi:hypothetical protein
MIIRDWLKEDLLSPSPGILFTMTEAYFSKPGMFQLESCSISKVAIRQFKRLIRGLDLLKACTRRTCPLVNHGD